MNAAARVMNQSNVFQGHISEIKVSKQLLIVISLLIVVLLNALAVIYTTNAYRTSYNQMERMEQQAHQLQLEKGQLLLEQASLAKSSRVQRMAEQNLDMVIPNTKRVFVIHN